MRLSNCIPATLPDAERLLAKRYGRVRLESRPGYDPPRWLVRDTTNRVVAEIMPIVCAMQ